MYCTRIPGLRALLGDSSGEYRCPTNELVLNNDCHLSLCWVSNRVESLHWAVSWRLAPLKVKLTCCSQTHGLHYDDITRPPRALFRSGVGFNSGQADHDAEGLFLASAPEHQSNLKLTMSTLTMVRIACRSSRGIDLPHFVPSTPEVGWCEQRRHLY